MEGRYRRVVDLVELTGLLQTSTSGLSIDEIAERFEVSRRTAERMLAALRERFVDLRAVRRDGRKYWHLPAEVEARPLQLPEQLATLSERVSELETEVVLRETETGQLRGLVDAVLGCSSVGIFVLDSDFKVVWMNETMEHYFGLDRSQAIGRDKRGLVHSTIRHLVDNPDSFERRVLATYDDNTYVEHFECEVLPNGRRQARLLEHWSQPIASGPYQGGRIEHYVDVTHHREEVKGERRAAAREIARQIEVPLAELQRSVDAALECKDPAATRESVTDLATRIHDTLSQLRTLQREVAA